MQSPCTVQIVGNHWQRGIDFVAIVASPLHIRNRRVKSPVCPQRVVAHRCFPPAKGFPPVLSDR